MARSISVIQNQIIANKQADANLAGLNSNSQTAIWLLWSYIVAVAINVFEQLLDLFKADIESKLGNFVSGTLPWVRKQLSLFQYSSTVPQVLSIDADTFEISYPTVDTNLQIITQTAAEVLSNNEVQIKVAKNTPPEALSVAELAACKSFLDNIMPAGIDTNVISTAADQIFIQGTIYYDGLYSSVIQTNVKAAINNYLQNLLPFGGTLTVSQLESTILDVVGVKDIKLTKVSTRRDVVPYATTNPLLYLLVGSTADINNRYYNSYAGYIVTETTAGATIDNSLTYTIS